MKKELITVIVPIYNVEKYLDRCINSVIMAYNDGKNNNVGKTIAPGEF